MLSPNPLSCYWVLGVARMDTLDYEVQKLHGKMQLPAYEF